MKIEIEISAKRIADLMVTAIEGNFMTRSWCAGVHIKGIWEQRLDELDPCWYSDPKLYASGEFTIEILEMEDENGKKPKKHRCNAESFAKGFALMAEKYGQHFGDFMNKNEDGITADVFLQCVALGDIVYG